MSVKYRSSDLHDVLYLICNLCNPICRITALLHVIIEALIKFAIFHFLQEDNFPEYGNCETYLLPARQSWLLAQMFLTKSQSHISGFSNVCSCDIKHSLNVIANPPPVPPSFTFNDLEFVTFSPIFCAFFAHIFVKIKCLTFILFSATQISPAGDL